MDGLKITVTQNPEPLPGTQYVWQWAYRHRIPKTWVCITQEENADEVDRYIVHQKKIAEEMIEAIRAFKDKRV